MTRLLLTFLVCAVTASQAAAQNNVSQTLFGLSEDQRNETFAYPLSCLIRIRDSLIATHSCPHLFSSRGSMMFEPIFAEVHEARQAD